jgi:hypothetical protein
MRFSRRSLTLTAGAAALLPPSVARAQVASPPAMGVEEEFDTARNRLNQMLGHLPAGLADDDLDIVWVDAQRQITALAGTAGASEDDRMTLIAQSQFGNMPNLFVNMLLPADELGFSVVDIQQAIASGQPPEGVQVITLESDVTSFVDHWEAAGYEQRENEHGAFWTLGEDGEIDFQNPVQRVMMSRFNNVAILDDRTLAFGPLSHLLAPIMETGTGDSANRVEEVEPISSGLPEHAVSAWILDGVALSVANVDISPDTSELLTDALAESDDVMGAMPVIRTVCSGTTAGTSRVADLHHPDARAFLVLETEAADAAQQAADVFNWRADHMVSTVTGQAFTELLGEIEAEIVDDHIVRFTVAEEAAQRAMFSAMIQRRDTGLLVYIPQ